MTASLVADM